MNVLIIEDEPYATERLSLLLLDINQRINIIDKLDTIKASVDFFKHSKHSIDLVFMDIELADGVCFEIFNQIDVEIPIVFTTAYDQYALKAFDLNSLHYLLKPVNKSDIGKALEKYNQINHASAANIAALSELLISNQTRYKKYFLGKYGSKLVNKEANSIAYFYSDDRMVYMVDKDKKKFLIDYTLEELMDQYLDPAIFYRVSRKYIVNISAVDLLKRYSQQRLQLFLTSGQEHEIVVSREKVSDFKNWLVK
ncbi:MAG: response regulator transcription factor [Cyclobacteriaceae bacterium]